MTEYYPFSGNEQKSMAFSPILDGEVCNAQLKWNISAQRWYLVITDNSDTVLLNTAVVGSASGEGINLISGAFSQTTLIWREKDGKIEVTS